jgi:predicted nucleic acid-binding protein
LTKGYLLDTSVISEFGPRRRGFTPAVAAWMAERDDSFHLTTISVAEVEQGIAQLLRRNEEGAVRRAAALEDWLQDTISRFGARLLSLGTAEALAAGALSDKAFSEGAHPGFPDVAIAATAQVHGLTILTRNLKHFVPLKVPCLDPFKQG